MDIAELVVLLDHAALLADINEQHSNRVTSFYLAAEDARQGNFKNKRRMLAALQFAIDYEEGCFDDEGESEETLKRLEAARKSLVEG